MQKAKGIDRGCLSRTVTCMLSTGLQSNELTLVRTRYIVEELNYVRGTLTNTVFDTKFTSRTLILDLDPIPTLGALSF